MKKILLFFLFCSVLMSCSNKTTQKLEKIKLSSYLTVAGNYSGKIICADCPGINIFMDLKADSTFLLEETFINPDNTPGRKNYSMGKWTASGEGLITLKIPDKESIIFGAVSSAKLILMDNQGKAIKSDTSFYLLRSNKNITLSEGIEMSGIYSYYADIGQFSECNTGKTYFVATEEDNANLEAEYLRIKKEPNEKIFVKITGYFKIIPKIEGRGNEEVLVVSKLIGFDINSKCK